MDKKQINISEQLLIDNGFVQCFGIIPNLLNELHDYKMFRMWTNDKSPIKIEIDNYLNNDGKWHVHIDNNICQTIGSADIDTVYKFNLLMEIFNSEFRL